MSFGKLCSASAVSDQLLNWEASKEYINIWEPFFTELDLVVAPTRSNWLQRGMDSIQNRLSLCFLSCIARDYDLASIGSITRFTAQLHFASGRVEWIIQRPTFMGSSSCSLLTSVRWTADTYMYRARILLRSARITMRLPSIVLVQSIVA